MKSLEYRLKAEEPGNRDIPAEAPGYASLPACGNSSMVRWRNPARWKILLANSENVLIGS
jgi:hypothetical protein